MVCKIKRRSRSCQLSALEVISDMDGIGAESISALVDDGADMESAPTDTI